MNIPGTTYTDEIDAGSRSGIKYASTKRFTTQVSEGYEKPTWHDEDGNPRWGKRPRNRADYSR